MRSLFFMSSFSLISIIQASPFLSRRDYVIHEKRVENPGWVWTRRLESHTTLPLRIGLKQRNLDLLPDYLMSVSDPDSPSYGQYWSVEEVAATFSPSNESHTVVREWLAAEGIGAHRIRRSINDAWVEIPDTTASEIEQLLDTKYHVYELEGVKHIACDSYSLPRHVADVVDIVTPTIQPNTKLAETQDLKNRRREIPTGQLRVADNITLPDGCETNITPDCLRAMYNITYTPNATDRNSIGIVSYYPSIYLQSDLDGFFKNFSPSLVGKSPSLVSINGGSMEPDAATDVGEDGWILEYAMTLVQPQPVMILQVGSNQTANGFTDHSFNQWLDAVDASYCTSDGGDDFTYDPTIPNPQPGGLRTKDCGIVKPPYVVSNSNGDHEYRFSQFYLQRQCNEFAKLGLMGVTVLYSAGNTGTAGLASGLCIDENDAMNYNATRFNPAWPASCPWVTAIGGTQIKMNTPVARPGTEEVWNEEVAPGIFFSGGGGFSNRFSTPAYQKQAVKSYLQGLGDLQLKNFNHKGRAYPDISANANHFVNFVDGAESMDRGTSGAVPTVASIIALVNDARISAGKKTVGFINPAIYSPGFSGAFNDITSGSNQGCKGLQGVRDGGFKAGKGWDPASGLGSPNLGLLIDRWLALP